MKASINSPIVFGALYILLIPVFALIFYGIPSVNNSFESSPLGFFESLYFSAVTITTLGYGDIHPKNGATIAQLLVASEAVLGLVTIGLFLNSTATSAYRLRRAALNERIVALLEWTIFHQLILIQTATASRIPQDQIRHEALSEQQIKNLMKGVFYKSPVPSSTAFVGPRIANTLQNIHDNIQELLRHVEYLDPQLIQIISEIDDNQPLEQWLRSYDAEPITSRYGTFNPHQNDISSYASKFHEIHQTMLKIREYWKRRFVKHPTVLLRTLSDQIHLGQNMEALKTAKLLVRYQEHKRTALYLSIVANLRLNKIAAARKAIREHDEMYPNEPVSLAPMASSYGDIPPERVAILESVE